MRRSVVYSGEESPPSPPFTKGGEIPLYAESGVPLLYPGRMARLMAEQFPDVLNQAFPPLSKGGRGGFSNADIPTKASHAP
jgi:hypothetical protein